MDAKKCDICNEFYVIDESVEKDKKYDLFIREKGNPGKPRSVDVCSHCYNKIYISEESIDTFTATKATLSYELPKKRKKKTEPLRAKDVKPKKKKTGGRPSLNLSDNDLKEILDYSIPVMVLVKKYKLPKQTIYNLRYTNKGIGKNQEGEEKTETKEPEENKAEVEQRIREENKQKLKKDNAYMEEGKKEYEPEPMKDICSMCEKNRVDMVGEMCDDCKEKINDYEKDK